VHCISKSLLCKLIRLRPALALWVMMGSDSSKFCIVFIILRNAAGRGGAKEWELCLCELKFIVLHLIQTVLESNS
jgi:type III secretory pathway component EscR